MPRGDGDILDNISGTAARIRSDQAAVESPTHQLSTDIQFIRFCPLVSEILAVL